MNDALVEQFAHEFAREARIHENLRRVEEDGVGLSVAKELQRDLDSIRYWREQELRIQRSLLGDDELFRVVMRAVELTTP